MRGVRDTVGGALRSVPPQMIRSLSVRLIKALKNENGQQWIGVAELDQ